MEVKSEKDRFGVGDLQKLQAYGWLYMAKHAVGRPKEVTLTALVHHLTPAMQGVLPEYDFESTGKGVYCRPFYPVSYVISIEGLPDELVPEDLQVFSNPDRRMRALLAALQKGEKSPILEAFFNLYESEVGQIMTREAMAKKLVKIAGAKKVAAALSKKDLLDALSKKDHLKALSQEDLIAAILGNEQLLKAALAKLKPEQKRKILGEASRN